MADFKLSSYHCHSTASELGKLCSGELGELGKLRGRDGSVWNPVRAIGHSVPALPCDGVRKAPHRSNRKLS